MNLLAEREGFEPSRPVRVYTISSRAPSTTRPPLLKETARRVYQPRDASAMPSPGRPMHVIRDGNLHAVRRGACRPMSAGRILPLELRQYRTESVSYGLCNSPRTAGLERFRRPGERVRHTNAVCGEAALRPAEGDAGHGMMYRSTGTEPRVYPWIISSATVSSSGIS